MQDESTEYHQFVFPLQAVPPSPLFVHYCMISPAVVVGLPWIGVVLADPATHLVDLIFGVSSLVNLRGAPLNLIVFARPLVALRLVSSCLH